MANIQAYPTGTPKANDLLLGTSVPLPNTDAKPTTNNFTVSDVSSLFNLGYKVYVASLIQTGTAAPVATVLQNDISTFGHFTIDSYTSNGGVYTLTLTLVGGGSNGVISENAFYDFAVFTLSSGLADKTFEFTQGVPAVTWNIQHNLGKFPSVSVVNNNNVVINGEITYIDNNNLTCNFSAAFAGKAYLN